MVGNTRTRSDIKREAIIQAATQAFQEFGVNGTSMDKLQMCQSALCTITFLQKKSWWCIWLRSSGKRLF